MTTRDRLRIALTGGEPDITPLTIYRFMVPDLADARWQRMLDLGLGLSHFTYTVAEVEHGVTTTTTEQREGGHHYTVVRKETPIGTLRRVYRDGWRHEEWLKTPADYRIMHWIIEHTELVPTYANFAVAEDEVGDAGVTMIECLRTPMMHIMVDWAGVEQFGLDIADEVEELYALYAAKRRLFLEKIRLVAQGPGSIVKLVENLSVDLLGAQRYRDFLLPVYDDMAAILAGTGKQILVHYDGVLQAIAEDIRRAPVQIIESLTEPPEGDMPYDACRAAWPDKVFWANINVGLYALPPEELRREVIARRRRAGKRGLLFAISEALPENWEQAIPVVLDTLRELQ